MKLDTKEMKVPAYPRALSTQRNRARLVCVMLVFALCRVPAAQASPLARKPTPVPTFSPAIDEEHGVSQRIDDLFNRAVSSLHDGRAEDFRSMLSSSTIERETRGGDAIDKVIRTRFIPFFAGMYKLTTTSASIPTQDPEGHKGIALGRSFITHDGDERSFIMYIVEEDGDLVVSNLLLDKTIADLK